MLLLRLWNTSRRPRLVMPHNRRQIVEGKMVGGLAESVDYSPRRRRMISGPWGDQTFQQFIQIAGIDPLMLVRPKI
jgi:hypothetical protein